jgi:hypothetical protein
VTQSRPGCLATVLGASMLVVDQMRQIRRICRRRPIRRARMPDEPRPPTPIKDALERLGIEHRLLRVYSLVDTQQQMSGYELDHLIPLSLGGAPSDVANLWQASLADSSTRDLLEGTLHDRVRAGQMPLAIASDWVAEYQALGLRRQGSDRGD